MLYSPATSRASAKGSPLSTSPLIALARPVRSHATSRSRLNAGRTSSFSSISSEMMTVSGSITVAANRRKLSRANAAIAARVQQNRVDPEDGRH